VKSVRFDPHHARFIPAIAPASAAFSKRSALEHCVAFCCFWPLRAAIAQRSAAIDNRDHDNQLCVTECGRLETTHNMFLSCPCFTSLWGLAWSWSDISTADPSQLQGHAIQFTYSSCGLRARRSFFQLI